VIQCPSSSATGFPFESLLVMDNAFENTAGMNGWQSEAVRLSQWCLERMAIKLDRHGCYLADGSARWTSSELTQEVLASHFRGEQTIGLGTTSVDDQCLFVALDLDNHVSEHDDNVNLSYALVVADRLWSLGFCPVIEDSDGKGGIHLFVFFSTPVKSETAFNFIRSVVKDFKQHKLDKIECFPKQRTVLTTKMKCGNYIRVPGKHPKRGHWSRFWKDGQWLPTEESASFLLAQSGDDPKQIPAACIEAPCGSKKAVSKFDGESSQVMSEARRHIQEHRGAIAGKRGHDVTFKMACDLVRGFELSDDDAMKLMEQWNKKCSPPWATADLEKKVSDARNASGKTGYLLVTGIRTDLDEESVNNKVIEALARKVDLYSYAGRLAIVREKAVVGQTLELTMQCLAEANLRELISSSCRFYSGGGGFKPRKLVRVPVWCTKAILSRGHWRGVPVLAGIVNHPVFRHDGTILQKNGFDPESGVYVNLVSEFPAVPDAPSAEEVAAAIELLSDVVSDFPFTDASSKSAWLASVLTPLVRDAHGDRTGPLFLYSANDSGAGKGLLADVTWLIVTGHYAEETPAPTNNEEMRKLISTYVRSGARMVLLDDVDGRLGCASLNAALTGTTWKDRLLKENSFIEGPLRITFYATGNNVDLKGDVVRRVCRISLETVDEHPEDRSGFKYTLLLEHVRAHRPALLAAALTVLRGYVAAGRPDQNLKPWGSFSGWSNIVRATLVWAGLPDPAETMADLRETSDEDTDALLLFYASLQKLTGHGTGKMSRQLLAIAKRHEVVSMQRQVADDLKEALERLCGLPVMQISETKLGTTLRHYRNRKIQGMTLRMLKSSGYNLWRIEPGIVGDIGDIQLNQPEISDLSINPDSIHNPFVKENDFLDDTEITSPTTPTSPEGSVKESNYASPGTMNPEDHSDPRPAGLAFKLSTSTSAARKKKTNKKKSPQKARGKTPSPRAKITSRKKVPTRTREEEDDAELNRMMAEFGDWSSPPQEAEEAKQRKKKKKSTTRTGTVKTPRNMKKSNRKKR
jgi:hypothetical protein